MDILPPVIVENIAVFGLLVVGFLVEKKYVSRPATFANALALNAHTYQQFSPPEWLVWYANIAFIVGVIAIVSYAVEESLSEGFYTITMLFFSSIPVAIVIIITF